MRNLQALFLLLFLTICSLANAQSALLYNNGTTLFAAGSSIVKVGGSVNNGQDGIIENNGEFTIDENFENNSLTRGNGIYRVAGNWINNHTFIRETSTVRLNGNNQFIGGDSVTKFYNLILEGAGVKTLQINSEATNILNINDRELATNQFDMTLSNPNANSLQRTSGFVSSLAAGRLIRAMNEPVPYIFPTGSTIGTFRYRPAEIVHSNTQLAFYGVRMANTDATLEGFDRNSLDDIVCTTNPLFFHLIERKQGSNNANIRIYYDPTTDQEWDGLANFRFPQGEWTDLGAINTVTGSPFTYNEKANYNEFDNQPYILSRVRPQTPEILGEFALCGGLSALYSVSNPQAGVTYTWSATNGNVQNTQGNQTTVDWQNQGNGSISVIATSANGCSSQSATEDVNIGTTPNAAFTFNPPSGFGTDYFQFTDQSTGASSWDWTFGNTGTSNLQNPGHTFNFSDEHLVMLVVTSADGCTDTAFAIVPIIDGFNIPNVFTPNGDGVNDVFQINGSGFNTFKCQIYNRWGNLIFESNAPQIFWDGKTLAGTKAPAGVYFVIIEIDTLTDPIKYNGTVTLLDPK